MWQLSNWHRNLTLQTKPIRINTVNQDSMTNYDKLMDVIKDYLFLYYSRGKDRDEWYEKDAEETSRSILEAVEEFQSKSTQIGQWRASD